MDSGRSDARSFRAGGRAPSATAFVLTMLAVIAIGSLVLQREIAGTITAALVLSLIWGAAVGLGFLAYARRSGLVAPAAGALAAAAALGGAGYYWFSVRDTAVNEEVVVAGETARGERAQRALAGEPQPAGSAGGGGAGGAAPRGKNMLLAAGSFVGADGHDGTGEARVIRAAEGGRVLTFTRFEVDPGAGVEVWLTTDGSTTEPRVELGELKGNVGDQQYKLPESADVNRFSTVMLYCTPFTVRIAYANLNIG